MTLLHMESDEVRRAADQFYHFTTEIDENLGRLRRSLARLESTWRSPSADSFNARFESALGRAGALSADGAALARRLSAEVVEWEQAAALLGGGASITEIVPAPPGGDTGRHDDGNEYAWWHPANLYSVLTGFGIATVYSGADYLSDRLSEAVRINDGSINKALSYLLRSDSPGSNESVHFRTEKDVTFTSVKIKGGSEVQLVRLADGRYELVVSSSASAGAHVSAGAEGELKLGKREFGGSASVEGEVLRGLAGEMVYEFDPNEPGDMTKLALFLAGLGTTQLPGLSAVPGLPTGMALPAISGMENLKKVEFAGSTEGSAEFSVGAFVELIGGEVGAEVGNAAAVERNENGQWEVISGANLKVSGGFDSLIKDIAREGEVTGEHIYNPATGEEHTRVTIDLKAEEGQGLNLSELGKLIPKADLQKIALDLDRYEQIVIEYEIDGNMGEIGGELIRDHGIAPGSALDQAKITIRAIQGTDTGAGISGQAGAGVTVGVGVDYEVGRATERVYTVDPVSKEWYAL